MITYKYTILYVTEVDKTVTFYENAFGFKRHMITPEFDYAELISGETTIAFASETLANSNLKNGFISSHRNHKPFAIELGLVSDDIEKDFEHAIANGAIQVEPIVQKPWGQKVAYVRDLNGFLIEICTPMP